MAHTSAKPTNQKEQLQALVKLGGLKSERVAAVMSQLDRADFCIEKSMDKVYSMDPVDIGEQQRMTSVAMHAIILEKAEDYLNDN